MYFEIYQEGSASSSGAQSDLAGNAWRWRLKCPEGETITSGESYADHAECLLAVRLIRRTCSHTPIRDA